MQRPYRVAAIRKVARGREPAYEAGLQNFFSHPGRESGACHSLGSSTYLRGDAKWLHDFNSTTDGAGRGLTGAAQLQRTGDQAGP